MSFFYKAYGLTIQSNIEFPQLITVNITADNKTDLDISIDEGEIMSIDGEATFQGKNCPKRFY